MKRLGVKTTANRSCGMRIIPMPAATTENAMSVEHYHKWFMVQTKNSFETHGISNPDPDVEPIYKMVEYAYMSCSCGEVFKKVVKVKKDD